MKRLFGIIAVLTAFFILTGGILYVALADHDKHEEKKAHQKKHEDHDDDDDNHDKAHHKDRKSSERDKNRSINPVDNPTYKESCGACHALYQPEMLPSASWKKIIAGLGDHFGETIEFDSETLKNIEQYLAANAAENSSSKRAVKIMKSLGSQTPLRITDIPYIIEKHHKISSEVLKRKSVGSLSNCAACHKTAEKGIYNDDDVVIPQ